MSRRLAAAAVLGDLLLPAAALAHPHVWVDSIVTAHMENGKVTAIKEDWLFDEDFSASVLGDVRKAKGMAGPSKAPLTPGEIAKLQQNAFSNLKNYDYFTHIWLNGEAMKIKPDVEGFSVRIEGDQLRYFFTVRPAEPILLPKGKPLTVGVWDDSYYVDVGPAKGKGAAIDGRGSESCQSRIVEDKVHSLYYGSIFPQIAEFTC